MPPDPEEPSSSSPGMSIALKGVPSGTHSENFGNADNDKPWGGKPNTASLMTRRSGGPLEEDEGTQPLAKTRCGCTECFCVFPLLAVKCLYQLVTSSLTLNLLPPLRQLKPCRRWLFSLPGTQKAFNAPTRPLPWRLELTPVETLGEVGRMGGGFHHSSAQCPGEEDPCGGPPAQGPEPELPPS